jgi:adenosyl cobinamide kinase/adenosyl cobinamide phosphate guanylyltransferase/sugar phosphate isomerase/epimerase
MGKITLILGGNRSGKSSHGTNLVKNAERVYYIATAEALDEEMASRIARHRASRPSHFITLEEPIAMDKALAQIPDSKDPVIMDCLTLYISNLVHHYQENCPDKNQLENKILDQGKDLLNLISERNNPFIIISNELGQGAIPITPLGRFFADLQGLMNQQVARVAHRVIKLEAGIPIMLKGKKWHTHLGTTSYIYPADIIENVKRLLGKVQDIELVFFDNINDSNLPSPDDLEKLLLLTYGRDLTFTVHFPLDLMLGGDKTEREEGINSVIKICQIVAPLKPKNFVLHLPIIKSSIPTSKIELDNTQRNQWLDKVEDSLVKILEHDIHPPLLCLENLSYPFHYLDEIIERHNLSVCLDVGHLLRYGYSLSDFLKKYYARIQIVHLHNSEGAYDHKGLSDPLSPDHRYLLDYLEEHDYGGILTLEVFNETDFFNSYRLVKNYLKNPY